MTRSSRIAIASLAASAAAFVGILSHEGYSEKAYPDPTYGTKVPTAGFGSTGPDITMQTRLPPVQAAQRALRDVQKFEGHLKGCIKVPLSQAEYDGYVSLAYNIGPSAFCKSGIVRELNQGNYRAACTQILRWKYSNGHDCSKSSKCRGLWVRRVNEYQQCWRAVDAAEGPLK